MPRVFIIAEAGVNHNGNIDLAYNLIDGAVNAGVDAVKFQTAIPELTHRKWNAIKADYWEKMMGKEVDVLEEDIEVM